MKSIGIAMYAVPSLRVSRTTICAAMGLAASNSVDTLFAEYWKDTAMRANPMGSEVT
jgi:hypothetical protein